MRARRCRLGAASSALLLAACVSIPGEQRAVVFDGASAPRSAVLACGDQLAVPLRVVGGSGGALDPAAISLVTWNIHKNKDPGWAHELDRLARGHAFVLLQEARLDSALRERLDASGRRWVFAGGFVLNGFETGVMTASRVAPVSMCTLREAEPLLRLPKAASVAHFRFAGRSEILAVANIHSVNFAPTLDAYGAQLDALASELARHHGPIILAGDLNTWTAARQARVAAVAERLGLVEVDIAPDGRRRFLGRQVDRVYVRGLDPLWAASYEVASSDHNPVSVGLRLRD